MEPEPSLLVFLLFQIRAVANIVYFVHIIIIGIYDSSSAVSSLKDDKEAIIVM